MNNIVTLKLVRGHSRSLKLVPFKSLGTVFYSPSIVTMAISVTVCEIFSVEEWCDLENKVRVRSRSLEMTSWRYLVSFARYSDLLIENSEFFLPHLYLAPP